MNTPTLGQVAAFGRHVVTFAAGAVTVAVALHVATPDDAQNATSAIDQIVSGSKSIVAGATTLIGLASALYASWTASPLSQLLSVSRNPDVKAITTPPAVAAAIPSAKVSS